MDELIQQFKSLYPDIKIQKEPMTSKKKLLSYEELYQVNSSTVFNSKGIEGIPPEIFKDWHQNYRIFQIMKGNTAEINTICY